MVEVKSATSVKDYHRKDAAIRAFVARAAGVALEHIALARIDSSWVYPGNGQYRGLLVEEDLSVEAFGRDDEVASWIARAQVVAAQDDEPDLRTGGHCDSPHACGFKAHCGAAVPPAEYPVSWLPRIASRALKQCISEGALDMRDAPDALLNDIQLRVKRHTLSETIYFDAQGAAADLAPYPPPACFVDFETIAFAVPIWAGTRPFQMIPFQFSVHRLDAAGGAGAPRLPAAYRAGARAPDRPPTARRLPPRYAGHAAAVESLLRERRVPARAVSCAAQRLVLRHRLSPRRLS